MSVCIGTGVACLPPPTAEITVKQVGGFMAPEIRGGLRELTVVFKARCRTSSGFTLEIEPGTSIFVAVEALAAFPWGKTQYEIDGKTFIIVPPEFVIGGRE